MSNLKNTENKSDKVIILIPPRMNNKFSSVVLHTINNIDVAKGQIIRFERQIKKCLMIKQTIS